MDAEIEDCARLALQETPFDRKILHIRATALFRLGRPDAEAERFWLRILRIDPDDDVARFYQEAAARGELKNSPPEYVYQVPEAEFRRRFQWLAARVSADLSEVQREWSEDETFRRMIRWAADSEDERLRRIALTVMAAMDGEEARSAVRQMLFGSELRPEMKLHIAAILKLRGVEMRTVLPGAETAEGVMASAEPLMEEMMVGERQLIRYAGEVLEDDYDLSAMPSLAMIWMVYRKMRGTNADPIMNTETGAAALVYVYLTRCKRQVALTQLAKRFGCSARKLAYYASRILETLEKYEGESEDEDL